MALNIDGIEYSVTKYTVVGSYESFAPSQLPEIWQWLIKCNLAVDFARKEKPICWSHLSTAYSPLLKREGNWSGNVSRNFFWDRCWGCACQLLVNFPPVPGNSPKRLGKRLLGPVSFTFLWSRILNASLSPEPPGGLSTRTKRLWGHRIWSPRF